MLESIGLKQTLCAREQRLQAQCHEGTVIFLPGRIPGELQRLRRVPAQGCSDLFNESLSGGRRAPDAGGLVIGGGDHPLALWVERRGLNTASVLQRFTDRLSGPRIPDAGGLVSGGGDDPLTLRVEQPR